MVGVADATQVEWSSPSEDDLPLSDFICARPPAPLFDRLRGRKHHPYSWELEAQTALKTLAWPVVPPFFALLAKTEGRVIGASWFEVDRGPVSGVAAAWIYSLGVVVPRRGTGLADELLGRTVDRIVERAGELNLAEVWLACKVHKRNRHSMALLSRNGWALYEVGPEDYDRWESVAYSA